MQNNEEVKKINVSIEEYTSAQITILNDEICDQNIIISEAKLKIAQIEKQKTQALVNLCHKKFEEKQD